MMVSGADRDSSAAALHSVPLRSFGWMEGRGMEVGGAVGLRSHSPHHGGGPHQVGNGGAVRSASRCLRSQCPPCNNAWMKGSENRPKDQCLSENFNFYFFFFIYCYYHYNFLGRIGGIWCHFCLGRVRSGRSWPEDFGAVKHGILHCFCSGFCSKRIPCPDQKVNASIPPSGCKNRAFLPSKPSGCPKLC